MRLVAAAVSCLLLVPAISGCGRTDPFAADVETPLLAREVALADGDIVLVEWMDESQPGFRSMMESIPDGLTLTALVLALAGEEVEVVLDETDPVWDLYVAGVLRARIWG